MFIFRAFGRLLYAVFFLLGGFLFAIPKWIMMGTRGSRERRKIIEQQKQLLEQAKQKATD
jgi:hypothetical protein